MKVNLIKHGKKTSMAVARENKIQYNIYVQTTRNKEKDKISSVIRFISIFLERNSI